MTPGHHVLDEQLDEYALGALPEEMLAGVEEHLLVCTECQSRLQAADEFATLFRIAAAQPDVRRSVTWWPFRRGLMPAWAAAAAVCAGVLIVSRFDPSPALPATVFLESYRGPETQARIAPGKPALLIFDLPPVDATKSFEVEIVDYAGAKVLSPVAELKNSRLSVLVPEVATGSYWVRIYHRDGHRLLAEYALRAK